jgi:uncharacterized protein YqhQ
MKPEKEIIVGGQAVIEGVMMRTPNSYAVAVRKQNGEMAIKSEPIPKLADKYPILKIPILRGSAILIHSMMLGIRALNFSATVAFDEAEKQEAEAKALKAAAASTAMATTAHALDLPQTATTQITVSDEKSSSAAGTGTIAGTITIAILINILLFIVLPLLLTNALFIFFGWGNAPQLNMDSTVTAGLPWYKSAWMWTQAYLKPVRPSVAFNFVDGLIRMSFFVIMIYLYTLVKDIRRVFEYHGAEHKTVHAWEAGEALTVTNVRKHPRQHPRCGTSFLMLVMLVAIVLFSVVKFDSLILNLLVRILLMPLVAGISYELIRLAGRKEASAIFSFITRPGIWLQNLTTQEPSDDQLEVAIYALEESLKLEPQEHLAVPAGS